MAQKGQFQKGRSGNPRGKQAGTRNRVTLAAMELLEGEAQAITRACIKAAKAGDPTALRLAMERIAPRPRGRLIRFDLPDLTNTGDLQAAALALLRAVAEGRISAEEAGAVSPLIEGARKAIETEEIERRLRALEEALTGRGGQA